MLAKQIFCNCWRRGLNDELLVENEIQLGFESWLDLNFIFPNKQLSEQKIFSWLFSRRRNACLGNFEILAMPLTGLAEAKLDWSGLLTLVYTNSQMRALACRIRLGGSGGMLPQGNFLKLDALRWLLRPFWGLKTSLEVFASVLAW